ncbi:hypothetical protein MXAN_2581 [Myxococcus xanthus DK 1622]|uniref:DUF4956 domain-containing protein n=1 Tax=Myxococcus xanthus (strain DK1622) TaxID=246197 RepID=Q1D973_MYXXD|nr:MULTISPECIES: DUF4956 domain-containing protein [Myxococcus]ABF88019.1 hypothetical protein MXAN_2581 [Myxococcus xanthus DK 1622]NOJ57983.1 DUF4956 domain-containing protein [Myxococcus xanthus]QPM82089.1 DUF4956 domain-containing protein [Myxococcus xanthus]QVW71337.1 DUF4956 domain-containing protein [Myxococcus xanthus DZ2]QZZ50307.1 hypothetical protein MyxoNM_13935 [Myxococcus xanthus]
MDASFSALFEGAKAELSALSVTAILPRMLAAALIGTLLSLRPWRLLMKRALPKVDMIQAQVLLCAAAAVITAVIGDSLAKAFGLVGLGGFVRFRSGLKDPRDAAILFLMIGLGMACGHGSLGLASVGTVFVMVLLFVLDCFNREEAHATAKQRLVLSAQSDDLVGAEATLRRVLGERNVMVKSCALDFDGRRLELEVEEPEPGSLAAALGRTEGAALRGLRWTAVNSRSAREERI